MQIQLPAAKILFAELFIKPSANFKTEEEDDVTQATNLNLADVATILIEILEFLHQTSQSLKGKKIFDVWFIPAQIPLLFLLDVKNLLVPKQRVQKIDFFLMAPEFFKNV